MNNRKLLKEILVLGDSHAEVFKHESFGVSFPNYSFNVVAIRGATISGFENPNSKTQALPLFQKAVNQSTANIAIISIGEVDTGFVIWYRAQKYNTSVDAMLRRTIKNYQKFLTELSQKFKIVCISTVLPTVADGNDWGDVATKRKEVKASQAERTTLTRKFNKIMQAYCLRENFDYVMLDDCSIGKNGLVIKELINSDPNDHHYDVRYYSVLIINRIKKII